MTRHGTFRIGRTGEVHLLIIFLLLISIGCKRDPNPMNRSGPKADLAAPTGASARPHDERPPSPPLPHRTRGPFLLAGSFATGEGSYVRSLMADGDFLWVGTTEGIIKVARQSGEAIRTYTMEDGLKSPYIFTMNKDRQGVYWFGTNNGGLSRLSGSEWKTYLPTHGLADFWVYGIDFAPDGTTWIATWDGVSRFDGKTFKNYHVKDGLADRWVYALAIDGDGAVWFGTEGGVSRLDAKGTWKTWKHEDGLGAPNRRRLSKSDNTGFGTLSSSEMKSEYKHKHNLSVLDPKGNETYNENYVFSMAIDRAGNKWFGTWGGGASRFDGSRWQNFTTEEGLAGNIVYAIEVDPTDGAVWFGTNHGVSRFDGRNWFSLKAEDGLANENVYAIAIDADRHLWLGEKGGVDVWFPQKQGPG